MKKIAIVDLGSNTIRLSVYQVYDAGDFSLLFSEKETAGLAGYVEDGVMAQAGILRAAEALTRFQELLRQFGMEELHVFATASLRNIRNTQEAVAELYRRTGLSVDVISGPEEARLGYYGALSSSPLDDGMLFDIGGGSTELVSFRQGQIIEAQSLEIGSLNLYRKYVDNIWPKKSEIQAIIQQIHSTLDSAALPQAPQMQLCGVGGTARAMLKLAVLAYQLQGRTITCDQLDELTSLLRSKSRTARDLVLRACPDRLHTIIPGALLMRAIAGALDAKTIYISKYGVREGYLCQKFLQQEI